MVIKTPTNFEEAVGYADERGLLPTDLSSEQIRRLYGPQVRRASIFSARTTSAEYLQYVKEVVEQALTGRINHAKARELLAAKLEELGYTPQYGFAQPGEIPEVPVEPGSLQDLSSEQRLKLIIDTQTRMAVNRGYVESYRSRMARYMFPAWELIRLYPREVPRGYERRKGELVPRPDKGWPARWSAAGGVFYDGGRMIARVDDPVWTRLGDSSLFPDGLDNPYPPFAFNSGMALAAIERGQATRLGLVSGNETPGVPVALDTQLSIPPPPKADPEIVRPLAHSIERDVPEPVPPAKPIPAPAPAPEQPQPPAPTPARSKIDDEWEALLRDALKTADYAD